MRAARAGSFQAQYSAAASLATGDCGDRKILPRDLEAAVGWYQRAAEASHADAQFNLASILI
jgi:TPR repeat protein